jgi:hypothetical protein
VDNENKMAGKGQNKKFATTTTTADRGIYTAAALESSRKDIAKTNN